MEIYHKDTTEEWLKEWKPKEDEYIKSQNPQTKADYIIDGTLDWSKNLPIASRAKNTDYNPDAQIQL